jgi:hypothetical protein
MNVRTLLDDPPAHVMYSAVLRYGMLSHIFLNCKLGLPPGKCLCARINAVIEYIYDQRIPKWEQIVVSGKLPLELSRMPTLSALWRLWGCPEVALDR